MSETFLNEIDKTIQDNQIDELVKETEENLSGKIMEGKIIGQLNDEILVME